MAGKDKTTANIIMTFASKHIGLIVGLILNITCFLFFGRQQDIYEVMLFGGLIISLISYLIILFTTGTAKAKLLWTLVIILCAPIQSITEPFLIDSSYRIYISQNEIKLAEVNSILTQKQGDISILNDSIKDENNQLASSENEKLLEARKDLGVYFISKSKNEIYYGLWGFLDVRLGITYCF